MALVSYLSFALANRRLVGFGFLVAMSSSFGQTFFIGVFGPSVQAEFQMTHTAWGSVYLVGTLASALVLPWSGKLIDRVDLRRYTAGILGLFVIACVAMSQVQGAVGLAVAIFLLRQSGQGLMSHVALTTMARYFEAARGRAIAIASLGFSAGEAALPLIAVAGIAALGWRDTYLVAGFGLLVGLGPVCLLLLQGHHKRHRALLASLARQEEDHTLAGRSWTRAQVLRDGPFYLMLPALLTPSAVITAMFFHHLTLADAKGWSHAWIAGNYVLFAAASLATALVCGTLIDRLGAARIMHFMLLPMALGMLTVAATDAAWIVVPYMLFIGVNTGISHTAVSALWAELYGVANLGAIKSLAASLSVFGSALGPVTMGYLIDQGFTMDQICQYFALWAVLASVGLSIGLLGGPRLPPRAPLQGTAAYR